jgi:hypothetical protein
MSNEHTGNTKGKGRREAREMKNEEQPNLTERVNSESSFFHPTYPIYDELVF